MATTVSHEWPLGPSDDPRSGSPPSKSMVHQIRQMDSVRRFAAQLSIGPNGQPLADLPDEEWESLLSSVGDSDSKEMAIARVIQRAHRSARAAQVAIATPSWPVSTASGQPGALVGTPSPPPPSQQISTATQAPSSAAEPPGVWILEAQSIPPPLVAGTDSGSTVLLPVPLVELVPGTIEPEGSRSPVHRLRRGVRWHTKTRGLDERQRQRWLTVSSWVRNIGAIILLFVAWQLWGTAIAQQHSQNALGNQFETELHGAKVQDSPSLIPASTRIADPPSGTVMAQLQIPAISVSQYVVSGTADPDLAKGPGHYLGTAMPGQAGNVAIAGHRTTHGAPFNRIGQLTVGNRIYLTTLHGQRLTYVVAEAPFIVSPSNVAVLNNFGDNRLTLTTCNPEFSSRQRLVVVASYLPPGASHPRPIAEGAGTPYGLAPADALGWNMGQMPLVLVEVAALVGLGLGFRRLSRVYGRNARWLILIPVWVALLVALFETLVNLLPASV